VKPLRGADRDKTANELRKRYEAGDSIRALMTATGRSYGYIHGLLTHARTTMRPRGGPRRPR
jgi:hypothetical protein